MSDESERDKILGSMAISSTVSCVGAHICFCILASACFSVFSKRVVF